MATSDYATTDLELLADIRAAAEKRLDAQLTTALAADQRALVFAGFLAAAAAAVGGSAASVLTGAPADRFLGTLALGAAVGFTAAMALALQAARPITWFSPGSKPSDWIEDVATAKPPALRLQELIDDYDDRIGKNEAAMAANANLLRLSAIAAFLTLLLSAAALALHAW